MSATLQGASALVSSTTIASKGTVNTAETSFTIAANDQIIEAEQFNDAIVAYRSGAPIRVRDIGQAVAGPSDKNIGSFQNGKLGACIVPLDDIPTSSIADQRRNQARQVDQTLREPVPQVTAPALKNRPRVRNGRNRSDRREQDHGTIFRYDR